MENIQQHIERDRQILDDPQTSPQARRHTEQELQSLERYAERHPNSDYNPTALELYCDENPDAAECRRYDV